MSAPPVKGFHGGEVYKPAPTLRSATQKRLEHARATGHVTEISAVDGLHRCCECAASFLDDTPRRPR